MQFSSLAVMLSLAVSTLAAPTAVVEKRALTFQPYNQFQVSNGVGGNALQETNQKFPVSASISHPNPCSPKLTHPPR